MRIRKMLIVVGVLSALAGCATSYHEPRESEPHATLTFQRHSVFSLQPSVWPAYLNEAAPPSKPLGYRRKFNVQVGTLRIRVGETPQADYFSLVSGSRYPCFLSFEAEAGKGYLVSVVETDEGYLYAVTADAGVKVAECKAPPLW